MPDEDSDEAPLTDEENQADPDDDSDEPPTTNEQIQISSGADSGHSPGASEGLQRILAENKACYLVVTASEAANKPWGVDFRRLTRELIRQGVLRKVYESPEGGSAIYQMTSSPTCN